MDYLLVLASVFLAILCIFLAYLVFRLRRVFDRLESILGKIDENMNPILNELLSLFRATRSLAERVDYVEEDLRRVGKTISRLSELMDLFLPDPKALKALIDGIRNFISSIFDWLFQRKGPSTGSKGSDGENK